MESIGQETYTQATLAPGSDQVRKTPANGKGNMAMPESTGDEETAHAEKGSIAHKVRKRTKTGCLTCRKRRIKCGEERPTCKNCTKSKRDCEGYVPRVVFKDTVSAFRQNLDALQEHHLYGQLDPNTPGFGGLTSITADGVPLAPLAPRPSYDEFGLSHSPRVGDHYGTVGGSDGLASSGMHNQLNLNMFGMPTGHTPRLNAKNDPNLTLRATDRRASVASPSSVSAGDAWPTQFSDAPATSATWSHDQVSSTNATTSYPTPLTAKSANGAFPTPIWPVPELSNGREIRAHSFSTPYDQKRHSIAGDASQEYPGHQIQLQNQLYGLPPTTPRQPSFQEAEDDPYDVDSEEENVEMDQLGEVQSSDLGLMLQMSACQSDFDTRLIENTSSTPNILATYRPAHIAAPLMDPRTARVFCHFITATGPTLNVCERHPANPALIFSGRPVPQAQRALWSYTLPMIALRHQGLLHSMLALSSLHIAKLQHTSPTPSLKHYHYALRRVAKALGNPAKRCDVATLAATLLLGFYEVTTAEHNKWNSHLAGARELIAEIDFSGMTRRIENDTTRREQEDAASRSYVFNGHTNFFSKPSYYETPGKAARKLDGNLIGIITGHSNAGQAIDDTKAIPATDEPLTPNEIETFQVQCDLFWWYAKQDVYQSILSNNRLLLSYDRWGQCPPRSSIGRQDAAYGTMDHLLLLLARLADFAAKDLPRKRRAGIAAAKAQAHAKSQKPDSGTFPAQKKGQSPPFYGMMPDPGPVRLPNGFDQNQHDRIFSAPAPSEKKELSDATAEAEAEHAAITTAFDAWAEALGPSFAPLSSEHMTPMATPFGPAIYYRSYPIACIQALFYCAHIIRIRTAPSMPAAAMAAAGVAAQATAPYANMVGRICAGIQPVSNTAPLNPHHGAALMDICMPLFHAGVQYQDPAQRGWTITKLRDVSRLTGWQTSALIASGCERAWIRAAEMGRGPPYERTMNSAAKDDRIAGRSRDPRFLTNPPRNSNDRRFVLQNAGTRVYWAMGILSVEEDMAEMSLNEGELE